MKITPINKRGRRYYEWYKAKRKLKRDFLERGITRCELCKGSWALSFHHRKPRYWYYTRPGLADYQEVLLLCAICHDKLQSSWGMSDYYFKKLR